MSNSSILLYKTQQIKELEQLAIEKDGLSIATLMQRAGEAAWLALQKQWPSARRIVVLCGKGNNAGDGYVLATLAHQVGLQVSVLYVVEIDKLQGAAQKAAAACEQAGVEMLAFDAGSHYLADTDVIVDALLGTGLVGVVHHDFACVIVAANAAGRPILALDLPSGLEADTGNVADISIRADVTITFIARKCGLYTGCAPEFCGEIICDDLGVSPSLFASVKPAAKILDLDQLHECFPQRSRIAHKGEFGHVLVVGGNWGMGGAVRMAAEAAARVGAGLVSVVTRQQHLCAINAARPELMCHAIENVAQQEAQLDALLDSADVAVIGPGLGQDKWAAMLLDRVLISKLPLVVDADALNLIAEVCRAEFCDAESCDAEFCQAHEHFCYCGLCRNDWILTPHPGEAARLLNQTVDFVQANRFAALSMLEKKFGGVVVLKGAGTLVGTAADAAVGARYIAFRRQKTKDRKQSIEIRHASVLYAADMGDAADVGAQHAVSDTADVGVRHAVPDTLPTVAPEVAICTAGNPGMASGGMGDVLSGIIGGLLAQGMALEDAAQFGVCLHSCAADLAAQADGEVGLLAMDLLPYVRTCLRSLTMLGKKR